MDTTPCEIPLLKERRTATVV